VRDQLEAILLKAQKLANEANEADSMKKALEAAKVARELIDKERERRWLRSAQAWGTVITSSTAAFAIVISFFALEFQFYQFRKSSAQQEEQFEKNSEEQREATQTSQWREALKNLSFTDDSAVLSSAVQMQSFFSYPPYSAQSRSVAAMLLPYVTSGPGFDSVVDQMRATSNARNQKDMISIAQSVVDEDWDLYTQAGGRGKPFADFLEDPTGVISEGTQFAPRVKNASSATENQSERDRHDNPLKLALTCSYNADTISRALARLWRENKETNPGIANVSLSGIVIENANLQKVIFSGANLEATQINKSDLSDGDFSSTEGRNTNLDRAILVNIAEFKGSNWSGTRWWHAETLGCSLADYLHREFPPSSQEVERGIG
jgi:hypothetical protein